MKKIIYCVTLFMIVNVVNAQYDVQLVKDINTSGDSSPFGMIEFANNFYFKADDGVHGTELWKSDGTTAGTTLLKDINSGTNSSNPSNFIVFNGKLYFLADDGTNGKEIWVTDGTTSGTHLFKNINTSGPIQLSAWAVYNNHLVMSLNDFVSGKGQELWISDGTSAGTSMLKDINPLSSSYPFGFTEYNGKLYFQADDGSNGTELWLTDGTASGTNLFVDINPSGASVPNGILTYNNLLFFVADNGTDGRELWSTDGTVANTQMLKDINNGIASSNIGGSAIYNGKLYFSADDGTNGSEIWVTNGTSSGTQLFMDINPGANSSNPFSTTNSYTVYNGKLYFTADNGVNGNEVWSTDGTISGTVLMKDLAGGNNGSFPQSFVNYDGNFFFTADIDGVNDDYQVIQSDGTTIGTHAIMPTFATKTNPASSSKLFVFGNKIYFNADYTNAGAELYQLLDTVNVGSHEIDSNPSVSISPNPARDLIQIKSSLRSDFSIVGIDGAIIRVVSVEGQKSVDVSDLKTGIYLIRCNFNGQVLKFIKE